MIVEKYTTFREGSAACSRVTTRVHSARRSQREPASIPARTSGREQTSGLGSGSTPCPNRGVAHAPIDSAGCEHRAAAGTKPARRGFLPFSGSCWPRNGSDCVDALLSGNSCPRIGGPHWLRSPRQPPLLSRLPSRRQPFQSGSWDHCEKTSREVHQVLRSDHGSDSSPLPSGPTALTRSANTSSAWRERPRPWPQAWQAKRPFRVVAHATVNSLAPRWPWRRRTVGRRADRVLGTRSRSRTSTCKLAPKRYEVRLARIRSGRLVSREGEHPARSPVPLPVPPAPSSWLVHFFPVSMISTSGPA